MSEYYGKEDETESGATALDNLRAQLSAMVAVDTYANSSLEEVRTQAEVIWNAAAERGDLDTQNRVTEIFNVVTHLKDTVIFSNEAMKGWVAAGEELVKRKKQAEDSLEELTEALYEGDTDHPLLNAFAESIETNVYEYAAEGFYEDAYEGATASIYDEFYSAIRKLSPGMSYFAIERFVGTLKGDHEMNDIQRGLLLSLLQTFVVEAKAS